MVSWHDYHDLHDAEHAGRAKAIIISVLLCLAFWAAVGFLAVGLL